jgi:hypothetical protein
MITPPLFHIFNLFIEFNFFEIIAQAVNDIGDRVEQFGLVANSAWPASFLQVARLAA